MDSPPTLASDGETPTASCTCSRCGAPDAMRFGDESICLTCYTECGSCCAGDE